MGRQVARHLLCLVSAAFKEAAVSAMLLLCFSEGCRYKAEEMACCPAGSRCNSRHVLGS